MVKKKIPKKAPRTKDGKFKEKPRPTDEVEDWLRKENDKTQEGLDEWEGYNDSITKSK